MPVVFLLSLSLKAQDKLAVIDWKGETTLRTYLLQEMHRQYDQRRIDIEYAIRSKSDMDSYRNDLKKRYLGLIGDLPAETPLNPVITQKTAAKGYEVENIFFESQPDHHVTGNLYIPDDKGPFPAVLLFCGHEMTSKATESYQKTAILFVTNGFVVFVVDPVSQGERVQFTDSTGTRILRGSTTEHTLLNAGANLTGSGVVATELFDNKRALDYLTSRSEVDAQRVGCLGNSGGGTQTAYFIAFDDRIKVAAPCSFISRRERNFELSGAADGCQHLPGEGAEHLEIGDLLIMFAPKPLLILAGRYDFVDYTGTGETYNELKSVYKIYNADDKVSLFTFDDGHGISKPKREAAVNWFSRWLKNENTHITEGEISVAGEKDLNCTPTGQVNSTFKNEEKLQDINLETATLLASKRKEFLASLTSGGKDKTIRDLLGISDGTFVINSEIKGDGQISGIRYKKILLRREGQVPVPCLVCPGEKITDNDTVLLILSDKGKKDAFDNLLKTPASLHPGNTIVMADLRGMGETAEKPGADDPKYYNSEYTNAMLAIHIGRPLPCQRAEDVLTVLKYISQQPEMRGRPIKISATGAAVQPALFAALFSPEVVSVDASSTINSWFEILKKPTEKDWYSYVIPGILNYFDLPDINILRPDLKINYK